MALIHTASAVSSLPSIDSLQRALVDRYYKDLAKVLRDAVKPSATVMIIVQLCWQLARVL